MARKIVLSDGKSPKKTKKSKSKKPIPSCPECGSKNGNEVQISPSKDSISPWSEVLSGFECSGCKNLIPAHLWERWDRRSIAKAQKEWQEKYKNATSSQEKYFKKAIQLLENHKLVELETHLKNALKVYPKYIEFWKLLGCAYGGQGEPGRAREAFLQALTIDSSDPMLLANYVTSCFHVGDKKSACNGIEAFFGELDDKGKSMVLDSLLEAVKEGLVEESDLPKIIFEHQNSTVQYVDEDGNPVDPKDIDPDSMEFTDEDGNPVDQFGNAVEEEPEILFMGMSASDEMREINKAKWEAKGLNLPAEVTIHGLTLVYKEVEMVMCGHGYAIEMKRGPEVAYFNGYRFPKEKPVIVEVPSPESKIWLEYGLVYEKEIHRIRKIVESLVDKDGKLNVHPNKELADGFRIYGGF